MTTGPDQVDLRCNGKLIDRVTYHQYSPGPASKSRGWQLSPSALNSVKDDDLNNWCYTNLPVLSEDNYYAKPFAMIDSNHAVWHFAWAISNLYRNGNDEVKAALQSAYDDALTKPETFAKI